MVYDLFTSADFCYSNFTFINIIVWFLGIFWLYWSINLFFFSSSRLNTIISYLLTWHYENIKSDCLQTIKGSYILISGLFVIILGSNIWGLFPYVFGVTTQMVLTFTLSLIIWLAIVVSSIEYSFMGFLCHLTPQGAPGYLAPILNLIELVSNFIRPFTLALRLSINMTTGHVLISLMATSGVISLFTFKFFWVLMTLLITGYILFEMGICFIQGFVFSLLSTNYLGEHT
uniref:ATP synthase subunit a n=1 Tax=Discocelis tigrina TaxID=52060 RepID=A0A2R3SK37_9PLAT|nr:ATP synthase F0 subunit 6 [Discocelis tigrina]